MPTGIKTEELLVELPKCADVGAGDSERLGPEDSATQVGGTFGRATWDAPRAFVNQMQPLSCDVPIPSIEQRPREGHGLIRSSDQQEQEIIAPRPIQPSCVKQFELDHREYSTPSGSSDSVSASSHWEPSCPEPYRGHGSEQDPLRSLPPQRDDQHLAAALDLFQHMKE